MPSAAPERVRLWTASTRIRHSSASIITFVTRSRPFCRPKLHTISPATTTISVNSAMEPGLLSMVPNIPEISSVLIPAWKLPVRNLQK